MTALRRGFKSEANSIARGVRQEMGLHPTDPLDPRALAAYLEISILPLTELRRDAADAVRPFTCANSGEFSAVTVFDGPRRVIVYNDSHAPSRRASDLAHELAHALLQHAPHPAFDGVGCRYWDPVIEEEAAWLAGALLVSDEAAVNVAKSGMSIEDAARRYGISPKMMQFRIGVCGAHARAQRASRWKTKARRRSI